MDLPESIETLNYRLERDYGKLDLYPLWRIVWSDDEREKRKGTFNYYDASGNFLKAEVGVQEVPKYNYIKEKFILERIVPVPEMNRNELLTPLSYEPVFVFERGNGEFLPPRWDVTRIVIETIMKKSAEAVGSTYKEPTQEEELEQRAARLEQIQEELFGNETDTSDLLHAHEGIVVPRNYTKKES
jgi:hypothetical protein